MKYRSSSEILAQILETCTEREFNSKTEIFHGARLSYEQTVSYTDQLVHFGLLLQDDNRYIITPKGRRLLELFKCLHMEISPVMEGFA